MRVHIMRHSSGSQISLIHFVSLHLQGQPHDWCIDVDIAEAQLLLEVAKHSMGGGDKSSGARIAWRQISRSEVQTQYAHR